MILFLRLLPRLLPRALLMAAIVTCWSCGNAPSSGGFVEQESAELQYRTVPADSSNVQRAPIQRDNWSQRTSWEFDSKLSRMEYSEWITTRLKNDFKLAKSSEDTIIFTKNFKGDTEGIVVHLTQGAQFLHVCVELSFVSD